jgi:hypothetical protein
VCVPGASPARLPVFARSPPPPPAPAPDATAFSCSQFFADHAAELHYYVQPLVVEDTPQSLSTSEYVAKLEAQDGGVPDVTRPLSDDAQGFLSSDGPDGQLLLVLGEAGSGKSMFTWLLARQLLTHYDSLAGAAKGSGAGGAPPTAVQDALWVPVVLDLKQRKVSELKGLLPRHLTEVCGLSADAVGSLRRGEAVPGVGAPARLLLCCDGFDELQAEGDEATTRKVRAALEGLVAVVCGGPDYVWSQDVLKVVVTCRESRLSGRGDENRVFGKHQRRVLLPFNKHQVCEWRRPM